MITWTKQKIYEIAEEQRISYTPNSFENLPYIGLENIQEGNLRLSGIGNSTEVISQKKKFYKGDILYGSLRPYFRKVVKAKFDGVSSTDITVIKPKENSDRDFLFYLIASQEFIKKASMASNGTKMPRAGWKIIKDFVFYVPESKAQSEIGLTLSSYDNLIENNEKRIKILEELAQRLYVEWFVNFRFPGHEKVKMVKSRTELGIIPEGWEIKKLINVTSYIGRGISPKYDADAKSIVINQKCIRNRKLGFENARTQSKAISSEKQIKFGDVLINSTGVGTLGRVTQVYDDYNNCTVDSHVSIVRFSNINSIDYLGNVLLNLEDYFTRMGMGATGQTELSRLTIQNTLLLYPPLELQKIFSDFISPHRRLIISLLKSNQNLNLMRDLLIPQLVTGRKGLKS